MALCITRRAGQKIMVGDDIEIVVTQSGYRTGVVKLAIQAPRQVKIVREELLAKEASK